MLFAAWLTTDHAVRVFTWLNGLSSYDGLVTGPIIGFFIFAASWNLYGLFQVWLDKHAAINAKHAADKSAASSPSARWEFLTRYKLYQLEDLGANDIWLVALLNQLLLGVPMFIQWIYSNSGYHALPLPSPPRLLWEMVVWYAAYELVFYVTHRALHYRPLFFLHARHHQTFGSIGLSGMYQTIIDFFLTTTAAHMLGIYLSSAHSATIWIMSFIGGMNSIHSHGGYQFPGMPSVREHGLHHSMYRVNYGSGPLDMLLGTYMAVDDAVAAEARFNKAKSA